MLEPQKLAPEKRTKREELFTERYERLLAWALRLTNQHRASAEDLVQDAFIQFVLGHTSLEEIENIDGYLRRMLRYMHLSRMSRSAQKVLDRTISITDYDSFDRWSAVEPARHMQAKEELCQICAYACSRKETSRAGSVLILRFFQNYYPSEIALILRSSRHCVDQWQRLARSELRLYMTERSGLRLMNPKLSSEPRQTKLPDCDGDLLAALRQAIFSSRKGECLSLEQLQMFYRASNTETIPTARLGHIVSCRSCLDSVNRLLGLPSLAERFQSDSERPEPPAQDKNGGGPSGTNSIDLRTKYQRRLREVSEHKPKELRIAVNGSLVSSLKVNADENELDLNLPPHLKVEFVEIFSEQGVQLLFFSLGETNSAKTQQWATIELSEGRRLKACLRFENGPALQVTYNEPLLEDAALQTPLKLVGDQASIAKDVASDNLNHKWLGAPFRLMAWAGRMVFNAAKPGKSIDTSPSSLAETIADNYLPSRRLNVLGLARGIRKPLWARPEWIAALLSTILLIGGFLYLRTRTLPAVTASSLLERSSDGEKLTGKGLEQVSHRIINLEMREPEKGVVISRRRIEIWQNSALGNRAERVYDESNRLIAGVWQKADGSRTVYHHGATLRSEPAPVITDALLNLDNVWQVELSAQEFSRLIGETVNTRLEETADSYLIARSSSRTIGASQLLKATLKLRRSDLHPIEQTLLIEHGGEVNEYRFVEAGFERVQEKDVPSWVFEPEGGLTDNSKGADRSVSGAPINFSRRFSSSLEPASAELEVDVAYLLNQVKGDQNEQVSLSRTATGQLRVEGVVDSEQRKNEFLRALVSVVNNPAVKIEIRTIDEAAKMQSQASAGTVTVRNAEATASTVAGDQDLRDYFSRKDATLKTANGLDDAIRSFSSRTVNRGYRALFHAIELKRLIDRFANVDMRTITPDARAKWLQMVHEHAAALEHETATLRQELQPIFFSDSPSVPGEEIVIGSDGELARAVERLHKLTLVNNNSIGAAFTISAQSSNAVKSLSFWRSLISAERLAARIKQFPG